MKNIIFLPKAFKEYQEWIAKDRKTALRIGDLINDILQNPFVGLGKPEPLKYQLIYQVSNDAILIISCYSHYI